MPRLLAKGLELPRRDALSAVHRRRANLPGDRRARPNVVVPSLAACATHGIVAQAGGYHRPLAKVGGARVAVHRPAPRGAVADPVNLKGVVLPAAGRTAVNGALLLESLPDVLRPVRVEASDARPRHGDSAAARAASLDRHLHAPSPDDGAHLLASAAERGRGAVVGLSEAPKCHQAALDPRADRLHSMAAHAVVGDERPQELEQFLDHFFLRNAGVEVVVLHRGDEVVRAGAHRAVRLKRPGLCSAVLRLVRGVGVRDDLAHERTKVAAEKQQRVMDDLAQLLRNLDEADGEEAQARPDLAEAARSRVVASQWTGGALLLRQRILLRPGVLQSLQCTCRGFASDRQHPLDVHPCRKGEGAVGGAKVSSNTADLPHEEEKEDEDEEEKEKEKEKKEKRKRRRRRRRKKEKGEEKRTRRRQKKKKEGRRKRKKEKE